MTEIVNVDQAEAWDGPEGEHWARHYARYDAIISPYHRVLMSAADHAPGERVLDIGCGNGLTSRDAARAVGPDGSVLGVDLSGPMLARAEQLAKEDGLTNVRFEKADAQVHRFEPGAHDIAMSRFGIMFFLDPVAAFTNIASALRPCGRLTASVWQAIAANEWVLALRDALAVGRDLPVPPPGAPSPFALADPDYGRHILTEAGFTDIAYTSAEHPWLLGDDPDAAYDFIAGLMVTQMLLKDLDEAKKTEALNNLRATIASHQTPDGVVFGAAAWIITAHKP